MTRSRSLWLTLTVVLLIVYQWWDGVRIAAPGVDADNRLPLLPVDVRSF